MTFYYWLIYMCIWFVYAEMGSNKEPQTATEWGSIHILGLSKIHEKCTWAASSPSISWVMSSPWCNWSGIIIRSKGIWNQ